MREELAVFLLAVQFLTRVPVSSADLFTEARFAAATRYYPLVGALVGAVAGVVFWFAHLVFPITLSVVLATTAVLLVTGAFHEDGFADACDGLGGGATREQALEIMRDSRLGTYGAAGLGLMLAAKILALGAAPAVVIPWLLVAAHAASRASAVLAIATGRYVREAGAAKPVADGVAPAGLALALATGAAAVAVLWHLASPAAMLAGFIGLAIGHVVMRGLYERKLGGYTGDCLGAVQQTSELGLYLGVVAVL
ncbi:MAG: adenosylcobinamide-GDP ribazoletransferase [Deltaproteobacteria bacterium]|nr:adenosylcobinamide-GDP ribazoletransferase [Deltaproteobacteria bacterium]